MADQGAGRNSGQAAGGRFVTFSHGAAQRIAKAVRVVEAGDRHQPGISFDHPLAPAKVFRMCTFTGAWTKTTSKVVTLRVSTATLVAYNLFANIGTNTANTASYNCAIARDGTAWYLIAAECSE